MQFVKIEQKCGNAVQSLDQILNAKKCWNLGRESVETNFTTGLHADLELMSRLKRQYTSQVLSAMQQSWPITFHGESGTCEWHNTLSVSSFSASEKRWWCRRDAINSSLSSFLKVEKYLSSKMLATDCTWQFTISSYLINPERQFSRLVISFLAQSSAINSTVLGELQTMCW